ncbi:MAG: hypothetical protein JXB05_30475 [Myxococcaceae bacterium]|nr:hypothetical protein [Myxococcaceae bacterium]
MRPTDVCTTVLVTTGNRALREPGWGGWEDVEALMSLSLRASGRFHSRVWMADERGERLSFQEWLGARASPEARLGCAPGPWELEPGGDSKELPAHVREAFQGAGGLGLLRFTDGRRVEHFMPREVRPRLYDITGARLYGFLRGRKRAEAWEAALTREFGPELRGRSLRTFLESRTLDEMEELLQRFMLLSAEVEPVGEGSEVDPDETVKWNAFFTPSPGASSLSFEYVPTGPGEVAAAERDVGACRGGLASALEAVREFSERHELRYWSKHFRRCLLRLSLEPQPLEDVQELLQLVGVPVPAVQLVNAAMASEVFGGMGSWNDLAFDGPDAEEYQRLSNRLLLAVKAALRAGLNSSAT